MLKGIPPLKEPLQKLSLTAGAREFILNLNGKEKHFTSASAYPNTIGPSAPNTSSAPGQISSR